VQRKEVPGARKREAALRGRLRMPMISSQPEGAVFTACREQQRDENAGRPIRWRPGRARRGALAQIGPAIGPPSEWVASLVGQKSPFDMSSRRSGVSARQKRWAAADKADKEM